MLHVCGVGDARCSEMDSSQELLCWDQAAKSHLQDDAAVYIFGSSSCHSTFLRKPRDDMYTPVTRGGMQHGPCYQGLQEDVCKTRTKQFTS
jgi:hypothetical protein